MNRFIWFRLERAFIHPFRAPPPRFSSLPHKQFHFPLPRWCNNLHPPGIRPWPISMWADPVGNFQHFPGHIQLSSVLPAGGIRCSTFAMHPISGQRRLAGPFRPWLDFKRSRSFETELTDKIEGQTEMSQVLALRENAIYIRWHFNSAYHMAKSSTWSSSKSISLGAPHLANVVINSRLAP